MYFAYWPALTYWFNWFFFPPSNKQHVNIVTTKEFQKKNNKNKNRKKPPKKLEVHAGISNTRRVIVFFLAKMLIISWLTSL